MKDAFGNFDLEFERYPTAKKTFRPGQVVANSDRVVMLAVTPFMKVESNGETSKAPFLNVLRGVSWETTRIKVSDQKKNKSREYVVVIYDKEGLIAENSIAEAIISELEEEGIKTIYARDLDDLSQSLINEVDGLDAKINSDDWDKSLSPFIDM